MKKEALWPWVLPIGLFGLILSSCATYRSGGRVQVLYVESQPPGATIQAASKESRILGKTPALVELRRQKEQSLILSQSGEEKRVNLETSYRWSESFWGNFVFLSYAPIGWAVDWYTGAAWTYQDPARVEFSTPSMKQPNLPSRSVLAIAPPVAPSLALSSDAAQRIEARLSRENPRIRVLPYRETLPAFLDAGFDFDGSPSDDGQIRKKILYQLQADEIFLSDVKSAEGELSLEGRRENPAGKVIENLSFARQRVSSEVRSHGSLWERLQYEYGFGQLLPNTVGLEMVSAYQYLTEKTGQKQEYISTRVRAGTPFLQALSQFESLTVTRLSAPRLETKSRFRFKFVPGGRFSFNKFYFSEYEDLALVEFEQIRAGAGIGGEISYQMGRSYPYLKIIPLLSYYQVSWEQPEGGSREKKRWGVESMTELGYVYFFNRNIHAKIFSKSMAVDEKIWNDIVHEINPSAAQIESPTETLGGFGVGYTFE